jgi:hypothetical protein
MDKTETITAAEFRKGKAKPKVNTNSLTTAIVNYLVLKGVKCWRQNNGAVYDKKFEGYRKNDNKLLGVPDICGYLTRYRPGTAVFVEVKTGNDKLSEPQQLFLNNALKHGCIVIVAHNLDDFIKEFDQAIEFLM